jgi:hypothetical protein
LVEIYFEITLRIMFEHIALTCTDTQDITSIKSLSDGYVRVMLGQENFLTPICIVEMNGTYAIDLYHAITRHPMRKKGRGRPRFQLPTSNFQEASSRPNIFSLCRSNKNRSGFHFSSGLGFLSKLLSSWALA